MTEKRFTVHLSELTSIEKPMWFINDTEHEIILSAIESKRDCEKLCECLNVLHEENKALKKEIHLMHMRSMFSTVKSFKGDLSKRYKYDEETDTIYDTANHYGSYSKILDKKEITLLLNEYNSLLGDYE